MNPLRSPKSTYVAAFLLGGLIGLLVAAPARAAEPFRVDRIPIVRFTALPNDQLQLRTGVLNSDLIVRAAARVGAFPLDSRRMTRRKS